MAEKIQDEYQPLKFYQTHSKPRENGFAKFKNGPSYFFALYQDGEIVMLSQAYANIAGRDNGIMSVKKNAKLPKRYVFNSRPGGKHRFALKAGNGQEIAASPNFTSKAAAEKAAESLHGFATTASKTSKQKSVSTKKVTAQKKKTNTTSVSKRNNRNRTKDGVEIFSDGNTHYFIYQKDGKFAFISEGYRTRAQRDTGVKTVLKNVPIKERHGHYSINNGRPHNGHHDFDLQGRQDSDIVTSHGYGLKAESRAEAAALRGRKTGGPLKSFDKNNQRRLAFYNANKTSRKARPQRAKDKNDLHYFTHYETRNIRLSAEGYPGTEWLESRYTFANNSINLASRYEYPGPLGRLQYDEPRNSEHGPAIARSTWQGSAAASSAGLTYLMGTGKRPAAQSTIKPEAKTKSAPKPEKSKKAKPPAKPKVKRKSASKSKAAKAVQTAALVTGAAALTTGSGNAKAKAAPKPKAPRKPKTTAKPKAAATRKVTAKVKAAPKAKAPAKTKTEPKPKVSAKPKPKPKDKTKTKSKAAKIAPAATAASAAIVAGAAAMPRAKNTATPKQTAKPKTATLAPLAAATPLSSVAKGAPETPRDKDDDYLKCEAYHGHKIRDEANNLAFFSHDNNKEYFVIYDDDGGVLIRSEGFDSISKRSSELAAVLRLKDNRDNYTRVEKNGHYMDILKDENGREVGRSCLRKIAPPVAAAAPIKAASAAAIPASRPAATAPITAAIEPAAAAATGGFSFGWLKWLLPLLLLLLLLLGLKNCQTKPAAVPPALVTCWDESKAESDALCPEKISCWDGSFAKNASGCPAQPPQMVSCWDGSEAETSAACPVEPAPESQVIENTAPSTPAAPNNLSGEQMSAAPAPKAVATNISRICGDSETFIFDVPAYSSPVSVTRLGTFPEFGDSHDLSPAQFYDKLVSRFETNDFDRKYLNYMAKSLGYKTGFSDMSADDFSNDTLPRGTKGLLGFGDFHGIGYSQLNVSSPRDLEAFRVRAANGMDVHFMKSCGNYMFVCN